MVEPEITDCSNKGIKVSWALRVSSKRLFHVFLEVIYLQEMQSQGHELQGLTT